MSKVCIYCGRILSMDKTTYKIEDSNCRAEKGSACLPQRRREQVEKAYQKHVLNFYCPDPTEAR